MTRKSKPEWNFEIEADAIGNGISRYTIQPSAAACIALAERFGVRALNDVQADLTVQREGGGLIIHVAGTVRAQVGQNCVVTLEPMETAIEESVDAFFADPAQAVSFARARADLRAKKGEIEVEMIDEKDAPEDIVDGMIDLGEVAAQFLALGIPAYPRLTAQEGADEKMTESSSAEEPFAENSPFAALKAWKGSLKDS